MKKTFKNHCAGFTLLEMVITATMIAVSWSMFAPLLTTTFNAFGSNIAIRETVNRARPALQRIRMELINASTVPIGPVENGSPGSSLTFTFKESPSDLTVTYYLKEGYLYRNDAEMVEGVTALSFLLESTGTAPNILYKVTINMTVTWMGVQLPLQSSVLLRKLIPCI